jgi:hypothetical protein
MRVLFIGADHTSSTSRHRAEAFRRLGHEVLQLDPLRAFAPRLRGNAGRFHYHTGYTLLRRAVFEWLTNEIDDALEYDLCWVDGGEMLGAESVRHLRKRCGRVILFNHDDPTGRRDWRRFYTLRSAIGSYDRCAVVRPFNVDEFKALGANDVIRVYMTYDEVAHAPPSVDQPVPTEFQSDVCFIGANYKGENRDLFLGQLIDRGINLAIWGDHWERSPSWYKLSAHCRGGSLSGRAYVNAIHGAKVCLGLLARRNRDEHTTRSMEIPFAGGLLCAQRTSEHLSLYDEGIEASFWSGPDECASNCLNLLEKEELRQRLRDAGMERVRRNGVGNEDMIRQVL